MLIQGSSCIKYHQTYRCKMQEDMTEYQDVIIEFNILLKQIYARLAYQLNSGYKAQNIIPDNCGMSAQEIQNDSIEKIIKCITDKCNSLKANYRELFISLLDRQIIDSIQLHELISPIVDTKPSLSNVHGSPPLKGASSPWYRPYFEFRISLFRTIPEFINGKAKEYEYNSSDNCRRFFEEFLFHNLTTEKELEDLLAIKGMKETLFEKIRYGRFDYENRAFWNAFDRGTFAKYKRPPARLQDIVDKAIDTQEEKLLNTKSRFFEPADDKLAVIVKKSVDIMMQLSA